MKKMGKFTTAIFAVAGLILIFGRQEWFPVFYRPQFMGMMALFSALLIILPNLIFKPLNDSLKQKVLENFNRVLIVILLLNGLGALGFFQLYKVGFEYDKFLHFAVSFLSIIIIADFCHKWYKFTFLKSLVSAAALVIIGGFLWEFFEFFGDRFFKTEMLGYYGKFIAKDTVWDLTMNFFGAIGGMLSFVFAKRL